MGNNNQIDGTDYYQLPCGLQLEDFIFYKRMNFALGSAVKYEYRAGKKDGESMEKDMAKRDHYINFLVSHDPWRCELKPDAKTWFSAYVHDLVAEAMEWEGK